MSFPRYASYKDTGEKWLGEVPEHWDVAALKRHFQIVGGSTPKSDNEAFWDGEIPWATPSDLSKLDSLYLNCTQRRITQKGLASCGTSLVPPDSIILSTRAPIGSLALAGTSMCTNQGCKSLVPTEGVNPKYITHLLSVNSTELNIRGKGTTFLELSGDELGAFKAPFPPLVEQTAIAEFLDRETAKIDSLVTEQLRLMELLKEKRQAVISRAITRGINPAAPLKCSGIEWLGDVPKHWRVGKLGHACKLKCGFAFSASGFGLEGIAVVRMNNLKRGRLDLSDPARIAESGCVQGVALSEGDLLWGMSGSTGETGSLGNYARIRGEDLPCQLNQRVGRFVADPSLLTLDFLEYVIQTAYFYEQIMLLVTGTAQFNVSSEQVQSCLVALPPLAEQRQLAGYLTRELAKLEALTVEAQRAIDLLQERRTALTSATVTGQIDVRQLAEKNAA